MTTVAALPASQIVAGNNDRTTFDPAGLEELADSIRKNGLIQPITVRQIDGGDLHQIVAGERRFRACTQNLGWTEVPAMIADLTDEEAAAVMLSENVSRQDIDPIDEANAYASRMKLYGWTIAECATAAGVSEIRVQFRLKLLNLRDDIQNLVATGNLQLGYAQVLASSTLDTNRQMMALGQLRDNPNPTPAWFRRVTSDILVQQAQAPIIETLPVFGGELESQPTWAPIVTPAHPSDPTTAPAVTGSPVERLSALASFWNDAAAAWEALGRPFKKQECLAAAQAMTIAIGAM